MECPICHGPISKEEDDAGGVCATCYFTCPDCGQSPCICKELAEKDAPEA